MAASLPRSSTRWTCHWFVITSSLAVWTAECANATMTIVTRLGHPGLAIVGLGLMANDCPEPTGHVRPRETDSDAETRALRSATVEQMLGWIVTDRGDVGLADWHHADWQQLRRRCCCCCLQAQWYFSLLTAMLPTHKTAGQAPCIRDEREWLFPSHSLPFPMVHFHSHSQSQV